MSSFMKENDKTVIDMPRVSSEPQKPIVEPENIPRDAAATGKYDDMPVNVNPGNVPTVNSRQKLVAMRDKERREQQERDEQVIDLDTLPVVTFPIKVGLRGKYKDHTGPVGQMTFANGETEAFYSYNTVMAVVASGFECYDLATGIDVSPLSVNEHWVAENRFWNYGLPLPPHAQPEMEEDDGEEVSQTEEGPKEVVIENGQPHEVFNTDKIDLIMRVLPKLRPGHKQDWAAGGMPDCRRLSALINEEAGEDEYDFPMRVSTSERDFAWQRFKVNKFIDPVNNDAEANAFAVPVGDGLKSKLEAILRTSGARTLRQYAEQREWKDPPRDGDELVDFMIAKGISEEDLKDIAR